MRQKFCLTVVAAVVSVIVLSASVPHTAFAQGAVSGDSSPSSMSPMYESAFEGYQPFQDSQMKSWVTANEDIAKTDYMGGMAGMGQENDGAPGSAKTKLSPAAMTQRTNDSDSKRTGNTDSQQSADKMRTMPAPVTPAKASANAGPTKPTKPTMLMQPAPAK